MATGPSTRAAGSSAEAARRSGRADACVRRSFTTWRARPGSVPGSKISSIFDRPGSDSERMWSRHGDAVEQVLLERDGDELLHLLGGEPERLGLHLHRDRRELGQRVVHLGLRHVPNAHTHHDGCDGQDDLGVVDTRAHQWRNHRGPPSSTVGRDGGACHISVVGAIRSSRTEQTLRQDSGYCQH